MSELQLFVLIILTALILLGWRIDDLQEIPYPPK